MTRNQFSMVSEWMASGNINQFVAIHPHENRFELVRSPFVLLVISAAVESHPDSPVGGCHEGLGLHAQPGNDPW